MKKNLCVILLLLVVGGAFAQEKKISQAEFDSVYNAAFAKLSSQPYRMTISNKAAYDAPVTNLRADVPNNALTVSTEMLTPSTDGYTRTMPAFTDTQRIDDKTRIPESKTIIEFVSPTMYRQIFKTEAPNPIEPYGTKLETIAVNGKVYTRINGENWKQQNIPASAPFKNPFTIIDEQSEYKFLGKDKLNGQAVDVYEKTEKQTGFNSSNNQKSSIKTTKRYWLSEKGDLLKIKTDTETRNRTVTLNSHTETIYEPDANITIEEPK